MKRRAPRAACRKEPDCEPWLSLSPLPEPPGRRSAATEVRLFSPARRTIAWSGRDRAYALVNVRPQARSPLRVPEPLFVQSGYWPCTETASPRVRGRARLPAAPSSRRASAALGLALALTQAERPRPDHRHLSRRQGLVPAVPRKSLCPTHARSTPVAVRPVIRPRRTCPRRDTRPWF